jgi:hypothetical protein
MVLLSDKLIVLLSAKCPTSIPISRYKLSGHFGAVSGNFPIGLTKTVDKKGEKTNEKNK